MRKFFPLDKNYLLEDVQLRSRDRLLTDLTELARSAYLEIHNPLGLNDSFSEQIRQAPPGDITILHNFYDNLAGIYRFKFGENQLGFLWDGTDHQEKYEQEWSTAFANWTRKLCGRPAFVQAVLDLTIFHDPERPSPMAENRMNAFMQNLFELRIHPRKGIVQRKLA